jgi:hypothetical protein
MKQKLGIISRFICQNVFHSHWYQPRNKQTKEPTTYLANTPENVPSLEVNMPSVFNAARIYLQQRDRQLIVSNINPEQFLLYQRKNIN